MPYRKLPAGKVFGGRITMIWVVALIKIFEGFLTVLTLGYLTPYWALKYSMWRARLDRKKIFEYDGESCKVLTETAVK